MKNLFVILAFLSMTVLIACSHPLQQYGVRGGRGQGYRLCPYQCPVPESVLCRAGTITGKITKISIEKFAEDMEPGIGFNVMEADGNPVHVHVGPLWFLEKRESDFQLGDMVTIEGLCYHKAYRIAKWWLYKKLGGQLAHWAEPEDSKQTTFICHSECSEESLFLSRRDS